MNLESQKHLFKIPGDVTYLNTASLSPSFLAVEEAGIQAVLKKNTPYLTTTSDFFEPVIELRKLFAKLIHVENYQRIATIPSVSYGMANVANNISLRTTDEVLIIDEQFPSNYYIWKKLTDRFNAKLRVIEAPHTKINRGKHWNEKILHAINKNTALVAMGNLHWSNGTLFDLKAIRQKTHAHNALLVIDGSQSIGAFPFSIQNIKPDAMICAGYKWLFGPYGGAFGYYGPYFDNKNPIEENWANRLDSEDFTQLTNYQSTYKPFADRYSTGESGSFIYVQMRIAALKQVIQWDPNKIQKYCKDLTKPFLSKLRNLGCYIENDEDRSHHMFGIQLPHGTNISLLKQKFNEEHIYVSFRGDYVRVSCHLFNTEQDFQKLLTCIESVINL